MLWRSHSEVPQESWRRRWWHPSPVLLPGKSHGWRSLVGCSPWGREESDSTERLPFHFSLSCFGEGNGNPLQCSCLENPRDGGAWWAAIYGVTQSPTWLKWLSSSSSRSPGVSETAFWSKWSTRPCRVSGSQSQKERSAQCSGRGREPASLRVWGCPGKHTGRGWIWDKTKNGLVRAMEGVQNGHSSLGSSESRAGQRSWDSQSKPNGCRLYLEETSRFYIRECNPQLFLCVCYIPSSMLSAYTF